jgi:hypothetical protein
LRARLTDEYQAAFDAVVEAANQPNSGGEGR